MKVRVEVGHEEIMRRLSGERDANLRAVRKAFHVKAAARSGAILLDGKEEAVRQAEKALRSLVELAATRSGIREGDIERILSGGGFSKDDSRGLLEVAPDTFIVPRTAGQAKYVSAIHNHDLVFCIGPAGTGKTYLAVAAALHALRKERVSRICLARPAVEAGERLGFLPGDYHQKVNPYLRPLHDALDDMLTPSKAGNYAQQGVVEIVPLAYMRGRTLNDAFVILDEAQNTTPGQMKMFLTRLGLRSMAVAVGDVTQIDLAEPAESGLLHAWDVLRNVRGAAFVELDEKDIVRHRLVRDIVDAYERSGRKERNMEAASTAGDSRTTADEDGETEGAAPEAKS